MRERLEFRILGPLEVYDLDRRIALGGAKQRALLAVLILHRDEVVSTDRLIDELWGERPPATAAKSVQVYVSHLRKALGDGLLETRGRGYVLRLEPEQLDLQRFERLLERGRDLLGTDDARGAAEVLREALALWRGPPLADLTYEPFAQTEIERLEELRLAAREDRIEADLALGRHAELVPELEALVREHPLRERLRGQLMLALYRSGRQAEALELYQQARRTLVDELGLEPGRVLQELEQAILRQDARLDTPARPRLAARARASRRRLTLVAASALLLAAAIAAVLVEEPWKDGAELAPIAADSVAAIDPDGKRIGSEIRVGAAPGRVAAGEGVLWVANTDDQTVSRIDIETNSVRQTIRVGSGPTAVAVGEDAVWVTNGLDGTVSRIDPETSEVVQTIAVGKGPADVAVGEGAVWVANANDGSLSRIAPRTGEVTATLDADGGASAVAAAFGAVWVADGTSARVARVDPKTNTVVYQINVGNAPRALAVGSGAVWVANTADGTVSRIDPRTNAVVATIFVGEGPTAVAVGEDAVWVSDELAGRVVKIDADRNEVVQTLEIGNRPEGIAVVDDSLLVAVRAAGSAHRGGMLRVRAQSIDSLDPARAFSGVSWAILTSTNDGLTAFKRVGGAAGTQLVPDLAVSLPTPTDGGRTYTFQLRGGIRYSTGAPVRASDFPYAIERSLKVGIPAVLFLTRIVGARRCAKSPRTCDLSRGIVTDDAAGTVTFRLTEPDPELPYKLALPFAFPVPAGFEQPRPGRGFPGTGPYVIVESSKRRLHLVRNPRFRVWSKAARPDGIPDAIVWQLGVASSAQVAAVERGAADVAFDGVPVSRFQAIATQHASQLHVNPDRATHYVFLNARLPPFDDVRVRKALNFAVDRNEVVRRYGGPEQAQPTCQVLPPNLPGYRPYCPYGLNPTRAGTWSAPDLTRARRLIAASGTKGMLVSLWWPSSIRPEVAPYVASLLRSLGYRVRVTTVDDVSKYFASVANTRLRVQAGFYGWIADYSSAFSFMNAQVSCGSVTNVAGLCDRIIDRDIRRALRLQTSDLQASNELWARIDRAVVDQAPWLFMVNPKSVAFVSARVGNYQYSPQWGILLDQLWVR